MQLRLAFWQRCWPHEETIEAPICLPLVAVHEARFDEGFTVELFSISSGLFFY